MKFRIVWGLWYEMRRVPKVVWVMRGTPAIFLESFHVRYVAERAAGRAPALRCCRTFLYGM